MDPVRQYMGPYAYVGWKPSMLTDPSGRVFGFSGVINGLNGYLDDKIALNGYAAMLSKYQPGNGGLTGPNGGGAGAAGGMPLGGPSVLDVILMVLGSMALAAIASVGIVGAVTLFTAGGIILPATLALASLGGLFGALGAMVSGTNPLHGILFGFGAGLTSAALFSSPAMFQAAEVFAGSVSAMSSVVTQLAAGESPDAVSVGLAGVLGLGVGNVAGRVALIAGDLAGGVAAGVLGLGVAAVTKGAVEPNSTGPDVPGTPAVTTTIESNSAQPSGGTTKFENGRLTVTLP